LLDGALGDGAVVNDEDAFTAVHAGGAVGAGLLLGPHARLGDGFPRLRPEPVLDDGEDGLQLGALLGFERRAPVAVYAAATQALAEVAGEGRVEHLVGDEYVVYRKHGSNVPSGPVLVNRKRGVHVERRDGAREGLRERVYERGSTREGLRERVYERGSTREGLRERGYERGSTREGLRERSYISGSPGLWVARAVAQALSFPFRTVFNSAGGPRNTDVGRADRSPTLRSMPHSTKAAASGVLGALFFITAWALVPEPAHPQFTAVPDVATYEAILAAHPYSRRPPTTPEELRQIPKRDRPDLAAEQYFLLTMDPATGQVPIERLYQANLLTDQLKAEAFARGGAPLITTAWEERGPSRGGGRTRALLFDPNDPEGRRVFAARVAGGLWVTEAIPVHAG